MIFYSYLALHASLVLNMNCFSSVRPGLTGHCGLVAPRRAAMVFEVETGFALTTRCLIAKAMQSKMRSAIHR